MHCSSRAKLADTVLHARLSCLFPVPSQSPVLPAHLMPLRWYAPSRYGGITSYRLSSHHLLCKSDNGSLVLLSLLAVVSSFSAWAQAPKAPHQKFGWRFPHGCSWMGVGGQH